MEQGTRQTSTTKNGSRGRTSATGKAEVQRHRIAEVMEQEGVSARGLALRLGTTRSNLMKTIDPTHDMKLSELYQLQAALRVPASELLAASYDGLPPEILQRTRLLRMMRTVRSIQEISTEEQIQVLAMRLVEKLTEIMPELEGVSAWPIKGQPRKSHELGAIACNVISLDLLPAAAEIVE